ncbi:hypothetical protein SAMN05421784_10147 [Xenorhabdus koppenhoeferi]|uniref:Uncharacterized protein n=1 Tax=Xenorhabdus koppenhoeferi TaxID=351659 RepID=A0A1I7ESL5_9GAMM|nr:hypothetical protein SAMN05421784_10147 [Xenorhabdus koppenhoeferi]
MQNNIDKEIALVQSDFKKFIQRHNPELAIFWDWKKTDT